MELKAYVDVLKRNWRIGAIAAAITVLLFGLASLFSAPTYRAEAILRIVTPLGGSSTDTNHETTFANRLMNTYAEIATSDGVMRQLKDKLGVKTLPEVRAVIVPDSEILNIVATGSDPKLAADAANGLAAILASYGATAEDGADSAQLSALAARKANVAAELTKYQQQHDDMIQAYSETAADMAVLQNTLQNKQVSFQNLQNQYEKAVVEDMVFPSTTSRATEAALLHEIQIMQADLDKLNQQYKDLSQKSNSYLQQITMLRQTIQNNQAAYSQLLVTYDGVSLATLRQQSAQNIELVSAATEPRLASGVGRSLMLGLGVLSGLIVGLLVAFLADNPSVRALRAKPSSRENSASPALGA